MTTLLTTCITNLNQKLKNQQENLTQLDAHGSMLPLYKNEIAFLPLSLIPTQDGTKTSNHNVRLFQIILQDFKAIKSTGFRFVSTRWEKPVKVFPDFRCTIESLRLILKSFLCTNLIFVIL